MYNNKSSQITNSILIFGEVFIIALIGFISLYLLKEFKSIPTGLIRYTKYIYVLLCVLFLMFFYLGGGGHGPFLPFIGIILAIFAIMNFPTVLLLLFVPSKTGTIFAFAALVPLLNVFVLNFIVSALRKKRKNKNI